MVKWPQPVSIKQLRGFLGLTGYYRRFIQGYAHVAAPLTDMLKKDKFHWTEEATEAFKKLKMAMTKAPVLRLPDFETTFIIETDASNIRIGAVLMQHEQPIAFFSKKLGQRLQGASAYHRELYAIVEAVYKWRQYLLGRFFIIRTDHKSIKEILQQIIQTPDQQMYVRKLMGYNFKIEYKPGSSNKVVDALSRKDEHSTELLLDEASMFWNFSKPIPFLLKDVQRENQTGEDLRKLHQQYKANLLGDEYSVKDGMLIHKGKFIISSTSQLKQKLLQEYHATPMAGHTGVKRTLARLAAIFYWPNMRKDVENFVAICTICQQTKYSTQPPAGLLQPLPVPSMVWEHVTVDFITGLPLSKTFSVIMVVVDRLTKYTHFGALPPQFKATHAASLFVEIVVKLHGFPASIVSDRDPIFLSKFLKELFSLSGATLNIAQHITLKQMGRQK